MPNGKIFAILLLSGTILPAQLGTGTVEGRVRRAGGLAEAGRTIIITGADGFHSSVPSGTGGKFTVILPYGHYKIDGADVWVAPLRITRVNLTVPSPGEPSIDPQPISLQAMLLASDPSIVTDPLDFTGLHANRLAIFSARAISWTASRFKLNGMDTGDPYQPGRPLFLADPGAIAEFTSSEDANEAPLFLTEAGPAWHGDLSTANSGAIFSWSNLPAPADRGLVQQAEYFRWFTRDAAQIGGPVARFADVFASVAGEWSSQTVPLAAGADQNSRLLNASLRARFRAGANDVFDALYSGSRIALSNFATPAGMESFVGRAGSPSFVLPVGFNGQSELDRFDDIQLGWTHTGKDVFELRSSFARAQLDTESSNTGSPAIVELTDGAVTGAAPFANLASRARQGIAGDWRHGRFIAGAGWQTSDARNRITASSNQNLITADGAPAFVVDYNTPANTVETVRTFTAFAADRFEAGDFTFDVGALADFSRAAPIRWNNLSPRAAVNWSAPHTHGLTVHGGYLRAYAPLAARDLDFADPASLSGQQYQWLGGAAPVRTGALLMRFGGAYSSVSPSLKRPYADEFDAGAEIPLAHAATVRVDLYRRDDRNRMAVLDTGVPFSAYTPVTIFDSFGRQNLTVFAQSPATLGQDRYLLTNPPDLRFETSGVTAELRTHFRGLAFQASFAAENGWGPTNPGDSPVENDSGVIGALYMNPNTLVNASARNYFDRGFSGRMQAAYRLPWRIDLAASAAYFDGLPFARQLLVTGLPQGPIVVPATIRGNPGNGNRAQYIVNWNLRVQREFPLHFGRLTAAIDALNVINSGQKIQESDVSGAHFLERLPVAIQEPRSLRLVVRYDF